MFVRCPFCHKTILQWFYESHSRQHKRKKPDGQQEDHVTTAPEKRRRGPLDNVPRRYRHPRCGVVTGMPEEIIRSYLVNPLLYVDRTFCCGCGDYVNPAELSWVETGENLMTYKGRLRAEYLERVLGISRSRQRSESVVVTPDAAEAFHRLVRERKLIPPHYFVLKLDTAKSNPDYACWLVGDHPINRQTYTSLESSGVQILVLKAQLERLRGTIVDYCNGPEKGFQMSRLYLPLGPKPL